MSRIEAEIEIRRPVEAVFTYLSDLRNMPEWAEGIVASERLSPDPPGPGTVYRLVGLLGRRPTAFTMRVTAYVPAQMYRSVTRFGPLTIDDRWDFAPTKAGTRVRQVSRIGAKSVLAPLAALATAMFRKRVVADLQRAANLLNNGR